MVTSIEEMRYKLGFLYRRCSMTHCCVNAWLRYDPFVLAVWREVVEGTLITDKTVLDIAAPLYEEAASDKAAHPDFWFVGARRGIHQLERAVQAAQASSSGLDSDSGSDLKGGECP